MRASSVLSQVTMAEPTAWGSPNLPTHHRPRLEGGEPSPGWAHHGQVLLGLFTACRLEAQNRSKRKREREKEAGGKVSRDL